MQSEVGEYLGGGWGTKCHVYSIRILSGLTTHELVNTDSDRTVVMVSNTRTISIKIINIMKYLNSVMKSIFTYCTFLNDILFIFQYASFTTTSRPK